MSENTVNQICRLVETLSVCIVQDFRLSLNWLDIGVKNKNKARNDDLFLK